MLDTKRPSAQLEPHRNGQLRAIAAGTEVSYSSSSKNYDGTYSAQRQELVEQYAAYAVLQNAFIVQCVLPIWESFVSTAVLSNAIRLPRGVSFEDITDAVFVGPQMPWIDPLKEASANEILEQRGYRSGAEIVRRMGGDPRSVIRQQQLWRKRREDAGLPDPDAAAPRSVTINDNTGN